jgi:hypothetical protein
LDNLHLIKKTLYPWLGNLIDKNPFKPYNSNGGILSSPNTKKGTLLPYERR